MANGENKLVRWNGEFGWNAVFTVMAAIALMATGVMSLGSWRTTADNSTASVVELRNIVTEIQKANSIFGERITKVEIRLDNVEKQGDRIERKIDTIRPVEVSPGNSRVAPR